MAEIKPRGLDQKSSCPLDQFTCFFIYLVMSCDIFYFIVSAACSALDYHGTSRRLFVGLASGTISVSAEFMKILMQSYHFFF